MNLQNRHEELPRRTESNIPKISLHHSLSSCLHHHPLKKKKTRVCRTMGSTSAVSMAIMPPAFASQKKLVMPSSHSFFNPLPLRPAKNTGGSPSSAASPKSKLVVKASSSLKEKAVTGLTAAALTASMMVPDVAEAATVTPSLKNFLLSIAAGGIVVGLIVGAVIGVSNFDPVKRS